jgi:hypothetical protein
MDLDEAAVEHNLAFFDTLQGLAPDARIRAVSAVEWASPNRVKVTDIEN